MKVHVGAGIEQMMKGKTGNKMAIMARVVLNYDIILLFTTFISFKGYIILGLGIFIFEISI